MGARHADVPAPSHDDASPHAPGRRDASPRCPYKAAPRFQPTVGAWGHFTRSFLIALLLMGDALSVGFIFRHPLVTDDPFITYRYARNLVEGRGFVYNAGEHVLSTTSPLYTLLLAALGLIYRDIPTLGFWTSVVSYGIAAYLVYTLAVSGGMHGGGILASLLLLISPGLVLTFGLETGLYLLLGLAAIRAYTVGRVSAAMGLAALLTLTRNDGVLLAGILGLHTLWTNCLQIRDPRSAIRNPQFWLPLALYLLILTPWFGFAWLYFGSPLPFTLAAKIAQAQSGLWDAFAVGFVKWLSSHVAWLVPLVPFALMGVDWAMQRRADAQGRVADPSLRWAICASAHQQRSGLRFVAAWALAHLVAYSLLGVAFYAWYAAPFLVALALFAGVGIGRAGQWLGARFKQPRGGLAFVVLVGLVLLALEWRADFNAGMMRPSPKVEAYRRAAAWIEQHTPSNAVVDALEVGVIGYYNTRRTIDFVGLVDPRRLPYLRARKFADGVRRAVADYVIAIPPDTWLPNDVWFKDAYRPVAQIRVPGFYGRRPLVIYRRADAGRMPRETLSVQLAFEKRIDLLNIDLYARASARGDTLPLRLHLRARDREPIPETWKFTLQLLGAADRIIAQTDNFYPARLPEDGKSFYDYQGIPIPRQAPPGEYDLILAMYDAQTGERLSLYDANGHEIGDRVALGKIRIE